jgi:hypothetical protein
MVQENAANAVPQLDAIQAPRESRIKNIALFVAAPFIGLVYAVTLPLVGVVMLVRVAAQAWMAKPDKT